MIQRVDELLKEKDFLNKEIGVLNKELEQIQNNCKHENISKKYINYEYNMMCDDCVKNFGKFRTFDDWCKIYIEDEDLMWKIEMEFEQEGVEIIINGYVLPNDKEMSCVLDGCFV
jgi:predicted nuclease with TOPRIM domain